MKKKDKIVFAAVSVGYFVVLFVLAALNDDRIISNSNFAAIISMGTLAYIVYDGYLVWKFFHSRKKQKENREKRYSATMSATLKHTDGLPLAKGVLLDVFYGPEKIVFKKDKQEISIARSKITSIDCVTGENIKSQQMAGAATGKYVIGGTTGALIGSLAATTTYLVISYTSDGKDKHIILDTALSGTFALKVQKDFKQHDTSAPSSIEL